MDPVMIMDYVEMIDDYGYSDKAWRSWLMLRVLLLLIFLVFM